ncbi:hypothetical protein ON010_g254 [Phytophthora cinnamomi]|nr:hypothetical protein ON010_g254 [Phytophthora cinnamomi]
MSSPLLAVELVLRHQNEDASFDHLIADYLGQTETCDSVTPAVLDPQRCWTELSANRRGSDNPSRWNRELDIGTGDTVSTAHPYSLENGSVMEWGGHGKLLDVGLLDNAVLAGIALKEVAGSGRLDPLHRIWKKHEHLPPTAQLDGRDVNGVPEWRSNHFAVDNGARFASSDDRDVQDVRIWLISFRYAATNGNHVDVMQYIYEQGIAVDYGEPLLCAIRMDNTDAVMWLLEHFPPSKKLPEFCVLHSTSAICEA